MQRSSVVLPEPLGPITTTTSPGLTASDTSRITSTAPNRLCSPTTSSIGRCEQSRATSMADEGASFKVPSIEGESIADAEINRCRADEDLERREGALNDLTARQRQLPHTDHPVER